MNERQSLLLRTLNSALELDRGDEKLSSDQVNDLASVLGFGLEETLRLVEALKEEQLVELHWPGKVSITAKGKLALKPTHPSGDHIHLEAGSTYVGAGAHIGSGAAVGQHAVAVGSVRVVEQQQFDLPTIIAGLVAAHQQLIRQQEMLSPQSQEATQQLAKETMGIQQEMRNPAISRISLEQRLDKVKGILEKLGGTAAAAASLKPTLELLHRVFDWLGTHLGSFAI